MRRITGGKRRTGVAWAALCALALTACGAERASGGDTKAGAGAEGRVEAGAASPSRAPSRAPSDDAEFLTFMELITDLVEPCAGERPAPPPTDWEEESESAAPPADPPVEPPAEVPSDLPLPEEPLPTSESGEPRSADEKVELTSLEKCEASIHTERITKAFEETADPTPERVGDGLRDLGYIDESVQGLRDSGDGVRFLLDLRVMGGQLCLAGDVTATRTVIEPFGAQASDFVECGDVRRHD
ncbi:hypothetical protein ACWD26_02460 [Streptomyces sp. NPDC002787]